jgi:Fe-S-cluster containining protein
MYENSVQFECRKCGNCCSTGGYVYLTTEDRVRLAMHLGLSVTGFTQEYCSRTRNEFHLKSPDTSCCFLKDGLCEVYEARPTQCRTWPFWPQNFHNRQWRADAAPYCKGVTPLNS